MKRKIFKELKKEFELTFEELIPGVLHNFANSLSGILGRSGLLEERARKHFELITNSGCQIDDEILEGCKKIIYDADLIAEEANRFLCLFNDVTGKFQRLQDTDLQRINLSELVEAEIKFLRFYPDSKDNIKIKLTLDRKTPEVLGVKADYPICLLEIIRHSMSFMKDSELRDLVISTGYDDSHVYVKIKDTGAPVAHDRSFMIRMGRKVDFPMRCFS
ncbi:MAG: hypothetical protein U9R20_01840 [Thermodesulfobacteriota bacterium]|nr:hypothetical protein [Thermodesulfobacteriota bacterium]